MNRSANLAIVIDRCPRIDDSQIIDKGLGINDGTGHHCNSTPQLCTIRNHRLWTDGVYKLKTQTEGHVRKFLPNDIGAYSDKKFTIPLRIETMDLNITNNNRDIKTFFRTPFTPDAIGQRYAHVTKNFYADFGMSTCSKNNNTFRFTHDYPLLPSPIKRIPDAQKTN